MSENNKIDLSGDGGVLKEIIKEGTGEETPVGHCKVSLHYTGRLTDGTVFDSSVERNEPFEFELGKGRVIKAFDMGVATMKLGEKCFLTCAPKYAYGAAGSPPSIPPNSTLIFELEMLGWQGEDLSPNQDSSIKRFIIVASEKKRTPSDGSLVKAHLTGKFEDRIFDDREVQFDYGEGSDCNIIEGVEIAIEKMCVGETSRIEIHPKYAFGKNGNKEYDIPPNAWVEYTIKLIDCEKGVEEWKLSNEECVAQAKLYKEKGTKYFNKENYGLAIKMYKKCIHLILPEMQDTDECKSLKVAAYSNIALCHRKLNDQFEAINACNEALKLDPEFTKALFRRGQCYLAVNELKEALQDFEKVNKLEPENKAAKNHIVICTHKLKEIKENEMKLYANMFKKLASNDEQPINTTETDVLDQCGEWTNDDNDEEKSRREADRVFERDNNIVMI